MKKLFALWLVFIQIGALSFGGGYAVLPLIERFVIHQEGWLSAKEMIDVITISQMTPGPIAINSATFVGTKVAGLMGSLVATLGSILPQFCLMMGLSLLVFKEKPIDWIQHLIKGLKPTVVGLIFSAVIFTMSNSLWSNQGPKVLALVCFIFSLWAYSQKKLGLLPLMGLSLLVSSLSYLLY